MFGLVGSDLGVLFAVDNGRSGAAKNSFVEEDGPGNADRANKSTLVCRNRRESFSPTNNR